MNVAIDSLLTHKDDGIEIIVIDDGSKDNTGKIADEYASKYPGVIVAHHQENGGHGEGINNALKLAKGKYFKVVDSDDWVYKEGYDKLINVIKENNEPDVFVMNYRYYVNKKPAKIIRFNGVFNENCINEWKDVRYFKKSENLTLHSVMYKTSLLKKVNVVLPKKVSYEDNYLIYCPLREVKTFYYIDKEFYCYYIGREGQSVSKEVGLRKYRDHLKIGELMFKEYDILRYKKMNKKQYKTMLHHLKLVISIGLMYSRLKNTKESKVDIKNLKKDLKRFNKKQYNKIYKGTYVFWFCLPNRLGGRLFCEFIFWLSKKVVPFDV